MYSKKLLLREVHQHVLHAAAFEYRVEAERELGRFTAFILIEFRICNQHRDRGAGADGRDHAEETFALALSGAGYLPASHHDQLRRAGRGDPDDPEGVQSAAERHLLGGYGAGLRPRAGAFRPGKTTDVC